MGKSSHSLASSSASSSSNNNDPSDNKHDQKLQAVLLADTFSNAFYPITLEPYYNHKRPLLLCPINNVPLLHHTIDFLQGNGVEELFILVAMGAEALEEYIRCHAEGGGSSSGGGGMMKSNSNYDSSRMSMTSSCIVDGGSSSNANSKIAWSSKLMISIVRITDCTNAGE